MHYDEDVNGTALDASYVPDELDAFPAHASAAGMIYSFYGRLSVGNMDPEWLREGDLPPTFYVYGTEDPFYRQFEQQYGVIRDMGIPTGRIVLNNWPHGFGADGGWKRGIGSVRGRSRCVREPGDRSGSGRSRKRGRLQHFNRILLHAGGYRAGGNRRQLRRQRGGAGRRGPGKCPVHCPDYPGEHRRGRIPD